MYKENLYAKMEKLEAQICGRTRQDLKVIPCHLRPSPRLVGPGLGAILSSMFAKNTEQAKCWCMCRAHHVSIKTMAYFDFQLLSCLHYIVTVQILIPPIIKAILDFDSVVN